MKNRRFATAHVITGICILIAGVLLGFIVSGNLGDFSFSTATGHGTKIEFNANNGWESGFNRQATLYTEDGLTSVTFSGKVTVDGTAELSIISNVDGSIAYSETYTDLNAKTIEVNVNGLTPNAYYTLRFFSNNAKKGHLILTTNQALVESPEEIPEKPERPVHN